MTSFANQSKPAQPSIGKSAFLVATAILLSRISGLVRESIFGYFFGISAVADAFRAALRIPNALQNLFGEGVLSASFIPVYAKLVAQQDRNEAGRVAGAIFSLLSLTISLLVLVGVLATPWLIDVIAPGFHGETRRLTIQLVRIFFPGIGLLVLSAWCLGILNSHGKFFLSYVSSVAWNIAQITVLVAFGDRVDLPRLAVYTAWASVAGNALQVLIQIPVVLGLVPVIRWALRSLGENVRTVVRNFIPAFVSRGVVQLSATVDTIIASFLPTSAVAALSSAQTIALLPVSLFGMSVSVAELPAMSRTLGDENQVAAALRKRIADSTRRIGFFVVPSAVALLALGDVVAGAIYQRGQFTRANTIYVWGILAGSAIGLVAQTVGRLYASAYWALRDTRTPLRFAVVRVIMTMMLGYLFALPIPRLAGIDPRYGAIGLSATAGFAAWVEFLLLRRGMNQRIGQTEFPAAYFLRLWTAAGISAVLAWAIRLLVHTRRPTITALVVLIPYGLAYLGLTTVLGIDQGATLVRRLARAAERFPPQPRSGL
ncbi:MAG TPA: murein biosynthesis integral membrane protein MurJ [Terriglobales bacterium]